MERKQEKLVIERKLKSVTNTSKKVRNRRRLKIFNLTIRFDPQHTHVKDKTN